MEIAHGEYNAQWQKCTGPDPATTEQLVLERLGWAAGCWLSLCEADILQLLFMKIFTDLSERIIVLIKIGSGACKEEETGWEEQVLGLVCSCLTVTYVCWYNCLFGEKLPSEKVLKRINPTLSRECCLVLPGSSAQCTGDRSWVWLLQANN